MKQFMNGKLIYSDLDAWSIRRNWTLFLDLVVQIGALCKKGQDRDLISKPKAWSGIEIIKVPFFFYLNGFKFRGLLNFHQGFLKALRKESAGHQTLEVKWLFVMTSYLTNIWNLDSV